MCPHLCLSSLTRTSPPHSKQSNVANRARKAAVEGRGGRKRRLEEPAPEETGALASPACQPRHACRQRPAGRATPPERARGRSWHAASGYPLRRCDRAGARGARDGLTPCLRVARSRAEYQVGEDRGPGETRGNGMDAWLWRWRVGAPAHTQPPPSLSVPHPRHGRWHGCVRRGALRCSLSVRRSQPCNPRPAPSSAPARACVTATWGACSLSRGHA